MSAYKLIEVIKTSERETQSIYDRDDLTIALADMKNDFGAAVKVDTTLATYCVVIKQDTGERMGGEYWASTPTVAEGETPVDVSIRQRVYTHNDYADDNIAAYDSERLAIGNFNTKAAASMKKAECNFALTVRIDGKGDFADFDIFTRSQAE